MVGDKDDEDKGDGEDTGDDEGWYWRSMMKIRVMVKIRAMMKIRRWWTNIRNQLPHPPYHKIGWLSSIGCSVVGSNVFFLCCKISSSLKTTPRFKGKQSGGTIRVVLVCYNSLRMSYLSQMSGEKKLSGKIKNPPQNSHLHTLQQWNYILSFLSLRLSKSLYPSVKSAKSKDSSQWNLTQKAELTRTRRLPLFAD